MNDLSLLRIYVMRAAYALIGVGLALMIWPLILNVPPKLEHMRGVVWSVLTAVSLLAFLGIRYPVQMIPLLFFELIWKSIWLLAIGLSLRSRGALTPATQDTFFSCAITLPIMLIAIPWRYVFDHYVRRPGDRWSRVSSL